MKLPENLRVLIADDDFMVRQMIRGRLEDLGHTAVGEASSGQQAVEVVQSLQPDIVLMDIDMPDVDGIEATRAIYESDPTPVVILTAYDTPDLVGQAGQVGAGAYLVKLPTAREIQRAIIIAMARFDDMMELRRLNDELQTRNDELHLRNEQLQAALDKVKLLSGLLPICSHCKKVRDDEGYWQEVEVYVSRHSEADFSHGICPNCMQRFYPEVYDELDQRRQVIIDALGVLEWARVEEIASAAELSRNDTLSCLRILIKEDRIKRLMVEGQDFYGLA